MDIPTGPFTAWIEHPIDAGICRVCGLAPPRQAITAREPVRAYSHAGRYCTDPSGRIIPCGSNEEGLP